LTCFSGVELSALRPRSKDVALCLSLSLADVIHLQPQSGNVDAASPHHDIFVRSYIPLAFVDPSTNCKAAVLVLVRTRILPVDSPVAHIRVFDVDFKLISLIIRYRLKIKRAPVRLLLHHISTKTSLR